MLKTRCPPPPPPAHSLTPLLAPPATTRHIRHSSSPPSRAGQGRSDSLSRSTAPVNHSSLVKTLRRFTGKTRWGGVGCSYLSGSVTPGGHQSQNQEGGLRVIKLFSVNIKHLVRATFARFCMRSCCTLTFHRTPPHSLCIPPVISTLSHLSLSGPK